MKITASIALLMALAVLLMAGGCDAETGAGEIDRLQEENRNLQHNLQLLDEVNRTLYVKCR